MILMLEESYIGARVWGIARREIPKPWILTLHRRKPTKLAMAMDDHGNAQIQHLPARMARRGPLVKNAILQMMKLRATRPGFGQAHQILSDYTALSPPRQVWTLPFIKLQAPAKNFTAVVSSKCDNFHGYNQGIPTSPGAQ